MIHMKSPRGRFCSIRWKSVKQLEQQPVAPQARRKKKFDWIAKGSSELVAYFQKRPQDLSFGKLVMQNTKNGENLDTHLAGATHHFINMHIYLR